MYACMCVVCVTVCACTCTCVYINSILIIHTLMCVSVFVCVYSNYILIVYTIISLPGLLTGLCSGCLEENSNHVTLNGGIANAVQLRVKMQRSQQG